MKTNIFFLIILYLSTSFYGWTQTLNDGTDKNPLGLTTRQLTVPDRFLIQQSVFDNHRPILVKTPVKGVPLIEPVTFQDLKEQHISTVADEDTVLFARPSGFFMPGLSKSYNFSEFYWLYGPAYTDVQWRNLSTYFSNYTWTLPAPSAAPDETEMVTETKSYSDTDPVQNFAYNLYYSTPNLTATTAGKSLSYNYGGIDSVVILAGGNLQDQLPETGIGNYDINKGFMAYYRSSDTDFLFGTTDSGEIDGIANFFEKPSHKYIIDNIWINAFICTGPADTELTLIVHKLDDNFESSDTLATSKIRLADVEGPLNGSFYYNLPFSEFEVYNEDLGFDVAIDYFEVSEAIMIELKGFNTEGVTLSVFCQSANTSPVAENNAYIFYLEDGTRNLGSYMNLYTSLLFNIGAYYSYLVADSYTFNAMSGTDSKTFYLSSSYPLDEIIVNTSADWFDYNVAYNEDSTQMYFTVTTNSLPGSTTGRSAEIELSVNEALCILTVNQGIVTGIEDDLNKPDILVYKNNASIVVNYPSEYEKVTMIDYSGRLIESYNLPHEGKFSFIPSAANRNDLYLLQFQGDNARTATKKIIY